MKKIVFFASLLCAGMMFTACESDDSDFNPTTDFEQTQIITFEGSYWDDLIDAPQYFGSLLYGENSVNYHWTDATTQLSGGMTNAFGDGKFWGGGIAISNYIDENISEPRSYDVQLAVPVSNGSKNFAVVYCNAALSFADGEPRVIKQMDVIGTTYLLSSIMNGDENVKALVEPGDYLNVIATGYNGNEVTGTVKIALAADGGFVSKWITVDLSALGEVDSVSFTMESNDVSPWGLNAPTYFAFDNVVIKE